MKTPSADLHELISSLNQTEKRHFRIYASFYKKEDSNKNLLLFDFIERQNEYDEGEVQQHFHADPFIGKRLNQAKKALHKLILRSLRNYHASSSREMEIRNLLTDSVILMEKKLFRQSRKLVKKARELAKKYERSVFEADALSIQSEIMLEENFKENDAAAIDKHFLDLKNKLNDLINYNEYKHMTSLMGSRIYRKGFARSEEEEKQLNEMVASPLFNDRSMAITAEARQIQQILRIMYFTVSGDPFKAYEDAKDNVDHFERNPHLIREYLSSYKKAINNFIVILNGLNRFTEMKENILRAKKLGDLLNDEEKATQMVKILMLEMVMYLNLGEPQEGLRCIREAKPYEEFIDADPHGYFSFFFIAANIQFLAGEYKRCNQYINRILNDPVIGSFGIFIAPLRILQVLTQFELGNQELLESRVRSLYRFYYKKKKQYKFENLIISFIRNRFTKVRDERSLLEVFRELHKECQLLERDPFEKRAFEFFNVIAWLESKIKKRTFAEVVKEKAESV